MDKFHMEYKDNTGAVGTYSLKDVSYDEAVHRGKKLCEYYGWKYITTYYAD